MLATGGLLYINTGKDVDHSCSATILMNKWVLASGSFASQFLDEGLLPVPTPGQMCLTMPPGVKMRFSLLQEGSEDPENTSVAQPVDFFAYFNSEDLRRFFVDHLNDWHIGEKDHCVKSALSLFFVLGLRKKQRGDDLIGFRSDLKLFLSSPLVRSARFARGDQVVIESSPFGLPMFLNSHSQGLISNLIGPRGCIILTDASSAVGGEGGTIFRRNPINGCLVPIGIVLSSLVWWKGEWIGFTLGANLLHILGELLRFAISLPENSCSLKKLIDISDKSLIQVSQNSTWGTGFLVDRSSGTFLTCAHVVGEQPHVSCRWRHVKFTCQVVYQTCAGKVYDVAVLRAVNFKYLNDMEVMGLSEELPKLGDPVLAAGFPLFDTPLNIDATVAEGCISKSSPFVLHTTCNILPGSSGGPVISAADGSVLGLIVCNTYLQDYDCIYPRMNLAIPMAVIVPPLKAYLKNGDEKHLFALETTVTQAVKFWNLTSAKL